MLCKSCIILSIQLLLLSSTERKICLSIHSDHRLFFWDTFSIIFKVVNCCLSSMIYIILFAYSLCKCFLIEHDHMYTESHRHACLDGQMYIYICACLFFLSLFFSSFNWTGHRPSICIMVERWNKAEVWIFKRKLWFTMKYFFLSRSMCTS